MSNTIMAGKSISRRWYVSLVFEPRDIWIGVYWKSQPGCFEDLFVYVCLVPCFPLVFVRWVGNRRRANA